ncbi:MAG: helix-hairpin-helix domain-containing protein [Prevotella sp.]|nr:helix-hairpin-helix domain-containing protein [Prevotella sp.]
MSLREFFYLQKSDRMAILMLLLVAVIAVVVVFWVGGRQEATEFSMTDSLEMALQRDTVYRYSSRYPVAHDGRQGGRQAETFPFDPNTADARQLSRLGLKDWQIRNLYKYREAGGVFRKPSDFARLYGLTQMEYDRLRPYIRIGDEVKQARAEKESVLEEYHRDTVRYPVKMVPGETVRLNIADTTALKHVPGIGSGYARRIVRYRQRLGGFYRVEQLREIDGFPESALSYFEIGDVNLRKLDINRLTLEQLKAHPYIGFFRAKAITDYRRLHGPLQSLQQLRLLKEFSAQDIQRLEPYIQY